MCWQTFRHYSCSWVSLTQGSWDKLFQILTPRLGSGICGIKVLVLFTWAELSKQEKCLLGLVHWKEQQVPPWFPSRVEITGSVTWVPSQGLLPSVSLLTAGVWWGWVVCLFVPGYNFNITFLFCCGCFFWFCSIFFFSWVQLDFYYSLISLGISSCHSYIYFSGIGC